MSKADSNEIVELLRTLLKVQALSSVRHLATKKGENPLSC